jgi:hypothetical protein
MSGLSRVISVVSTHFCSSSSTSLPPPRRNRRSKMRPTVMSRQRALPVAVSSSRFRRNSRVPTGMVTGNEMEKRKMPSRSLLRRHRGSTVPTSWSESPMPTSCEDPSRWISSRHCSLTWSGSHSRSRRFSETAGKRAAVRHLLSSFIEDDAQLVLDEFQFTNFQGDSR